MSKIIRLKRGNVLDMLLTPTFISVVVLAIIYPGLLIKIYDFGSETSYEKEYLSIKHALILYALQDMNGNAFLFDSSKFNFSYNYSKNTVEVFDDSGKASHFIEDKKVKVGYKKLIFNGKTISPIILSKQGNEIIVDSTSLNPDFKPNMNLLTCLDIPTAHIRKITLDPGHGWSEKLASEGSNMPGDKGFINTANGLRESEVNLKLVASLNSLLQQDSTTSSISLTQTRDLKSDQRKSNKERLEAIQGDSLLSMHAGSYENKKLTPVKAYINVRSSKKNESQKLACLILNSLSNKIPEISSISIVPVDAALLETFDEENSKRVLPEDKVGVLLEIGNIQITEKNILKDKIKDIAEAIHDGIKDYQG